MCICFFFFKQKTAYEMRISDWSSDVCSSDLDLGAHIAKQLAAEGSRDQLPHLHDPDAFQRAPAARLAHIIPFAADSGKTACLAHGLCILRMLCNFQPAK